MTAITIQMTITTATTTATMICVFLNFNADEVLTFFNLLIQLNNQTSDKQKCKQK